MPPSLAGGIEHSGRLYMRLSVCRLYVHPKTKVTIFVQGRILSCINGSRSDHRAPDKMRICVFHSNLNVKNSIIFGNVRIMYAKHFPDTQLCPVSKRICFVLGVSIA